MKKTTYLLLGLLLPVLAWAQNAPSVVDPAISPDGNTVLFSYQGDIWSVPFSGGEAKRLTIHEAYDGNPYWSPDGNQVAFNSDRYGNDDIFVMPATGGFPKRITYRSGYDQLTNWTKDGQLLFSTNREYRQIEWDSEIYQVSAEGGTPTRLLDALGYMANQSPNQRFVAFTKGSCRAAREDYRGPANKNIFLFDSKNKSFQQITSFEGNDYLPIWISDTDFCYISASSGKYNVYRQTVDAEGKPSGQPKALTSYSDYGVNAFDISSNGKMVFERMGSLYIVENGGQPKKLMLNLGADYRFDPVEHKTMSNGVSDYAVSPNGKLLAFAVHGEIFVKENDKEKRRSVNVSDHPYRESEPLWLNDSTLLFISDQDGNKEIYLAQSSDEEQVNLFKTLKRKTLRLTKTDSHETNLSLSPDGKKLAFQRDKAFIVAEINENGKLSKENTLLESWASPSGVAWSPDSKWLAYSLENLNFNYEVFIHAADNSQKPVNVSMHPRRDFNPEWSADGKKLGFISNRNNGDNDVWFAWLTKKDWEKTKQDWEEAEEEPKKDKKKKEDKEKGDDEEEDAVEPIAIDLENIHERLVQVTSMPGDEGSLAVDPKSEFFYFTAYNSTKDGSDLFKAKWDGSETKQISKDGGNPYALRLAADGKMYFIKKRGLYQLDPASDKTESLGFSAKMSINRQQENEQLFEEAWAMLNDYFYDPGFHGKDFGKLKKDYREIVMASSTKRDFRYFFNMMLGQLNASHMGLYGSDEAETQNEQTGLLGIEVTPQKKGVTITRIVPNSPADKEDSKLEAGETILSIDGTPITEGMNFYQLLTNTVSEKVLLEVSGTDKKTREVVIRPVRSLRSELYNEWIDDQRELTEKYSNGKLGYIHIQGMNWPSFERFERELTAAGYGKEGIVIDVRYNGGGWTTDYLMAVLNVKQHAYTIPRGAAASLDENTQFTDYYPYGERLPFGAWTKPAIALCNASSYSNAEIFSHAFKTLGRGKLVGIPTFGAVISTGGARLIDGSLIRLPFRAWYVKATGENMELGPAVPDFTVENPVDNRAKNTDDQLKKAVDELLKEVK